MCGIAGIARTRDAATDDAEVVRAMMDRLAHRGPDGEGLLAAGRVTLGHRRLAILDLSPAGRQPMEDPSGRYAIVFNGEIYNFRELATELGLAAGALRSRSDTEVLLHAWARWGASALDRLVGQWAFALYDRAEGTLWLCRDRFGEKPLFWHADGERVAFASSLESLFADPRTPRALDPSALVEYVTLRYVLAPRTVVAGVHKLPAGSWLRIANDGTRTEHAWYRPRFHPDPARTAPTPGERAERFDELFRRAALRCTVSDVPVGLLLSDGIDSQSVRTALEAAGAPLHAYTFRLEGGQRTAADVPGVSTTTIELSPAEYRGGMARTCALQTEPIGDLAALATAAVIAKSRDRATVFLCGHGADEILGGYRLSQERFRLAALWRFGRLPLAFVRRGLDRHLRGDEPLAVRARRFLDGPAREAPAAARFLIQRPVRTPELAQLFGDAWPAGERHLAAVDRLYGECPPEATDLERMQEVMVRSFLSEDILPYADSCAMAAAAELRMPYLDRDLVEFVCALPDGERVGRLPGRVNTKLPLRRWARGRLPEEVRARGKEPFAVGAFAEVFPDIEMARGPILGCRALRRAMPGLEAWFTARASGWPLRADGVVWTLLSLALWADAAGAE